MEQTTFNAVAGNIKRKYSHEDFNPYLVMLHVYNHLLQSGPGRVVTIIGHTERYQADIVKAWWHVMAEKGHLDLQQAPPIPLGGQFATHTGTMIRFEYYKDIAGKQVDFQASCKQADNVVLCSDYNSPEFMCIIREQSLLRQVLSFSQNNTKPVDESKEVD